MKNMFYRCGLIALFWAIMQPAAAQEAPAPVRWYLYGGIGATAYRGDLSSSYERWTAMLHAGIQSYRKRVLNPRFEVFYGELNGQQLAYTYPDGTPNSFFHTRWAGATAHLNLHLIKKNNWTLYISQGLGLAYFVPYDKNEKPLDSQNNTRSLGETYTNIALLLPTSIGAVYFFDNQFGIAAECGVFNVQNDYLDNIGKWGNDAGNDNVLRFKFSFYAPLLRMKTASEKQKK